MLCWRLRVGAMQLCSPAVCLMHIQPQSTPEAVSAHVIIARGQHHTAAMHQLDSKDAIPLLTLSLLLRALTPVHTIQPSSDVYCLCPCCHTACPAAPAPASAQTLLLNPLPNQRPSEASPQSQPVQPRRPKLHPPRVATAQSRHRAKTITETF